MSQIFRNRGVKVPDDTKQIEEVRAKVIYESDTDDIINQYINR